MANFSPAFEAMIRNEGGYQLHTTPGDRGGQTYAGIARKFHPDWTGWTWIDQQALDDPALTAQVRDFYWKNFWERIQGEKIQAQKIAATLFDFAVNAGHRTASKLAQLVVDATPDGVIGQQTLARLNACDAETFVIQYALAKIARYAQIVNRDRSQNKFLLGWINRTLKEVI